MRNVCQLSLRKKETYHFRYIKSKKFQEAKTGEANNSILSKCTVLLLASYGLNVELLIPSIVCQFSAA